MGANKRLDSTLLGLVMGVIFPAIALTIFWLVRYDGNFFAFLSNFQRLGLLSKTLSLCAIPNLLLFFLFIWTNRSFSARGVIFATLVIAFVMLVLKFA